MNKTFTKLKCTAVAAVALAAFCALPASAQLNYGATSSVNTTTTYTDLGTTGTAITTASNDDAFSAAIPIGFTFSFNGATFTDFILSTNGFIKLGSTAPSAVTLLNAIGSANAADINIIAASSNIDLQGAADQVANPTEYRVATTGTAPNRVTTIQWKNVADKLSASAPAQMATMQFQIKLYETTNVVELVYGTFTASTNTPTGQPFIIGLKGSSNAVINRLMAYKGSSASAWSTTTFVNEDPTSPGSLVAHFIRNTFLPDAGRTYRFTPTVVLANDLSVQDIFTQGKISVAGGAPHAVKAIVKNVGSAVATNKTVTLTISGVNASTLTATIASLAAGATTEVTFPAYTPTTVGQNFLEVTVPTDDNNTNNLRDETQFVTADQESYSLYPSATGNPVPETVNNGPFGSTPATNGGARLSKFTTVNRVRINSVRTYIAHNNGPTNPNFNTIGRTVKAIVVDAAGNVIGESAPLTLTANDVDKFIDIPLTTPAIVENADYFVGLDLAVSSTATANSLVFTSQNQALLRTGATYVMPSPGATPVAPTASNTLMLLLYEAQLTNITGVKEELNAKLVSVYPNPSNGVFNVSAKDMKGSNLNLVVRDLQGKVVYSANAAKEGASINLKNLASGIYMLQVATDSEIAVKRLVIQ